MFCCLIDVYRRARLMCLYTRWHALHSLAERHASPPRKIHYPLPSSSRAIAKAAHRVRFFWIRTPESIGLLGPTESYSSVDSGSWLGKKNRTLPWTRTLGSKPDRTPPWTRTPGSKANRALPWTRTRGPAPGRALVWTRAPGLVGLAAARRVSATTARPSFLVGRGASSSTM
jgi:hypothetical protein